MKKLAVLMPTYNSAAYLTESIQSILNQTFTDFDLFIYDDCSIDNTHQLIAQYKDSRLIYRKNIVNLGIAKTLNKGFDELLSSYEYIARMDADDWSYPDRFEKQVQYLDKNIDVSLLGTQGYWLKDISRNPKFGWEYPIRDHYIRYHLLFAASFGHSSVMLRSSFFINNNLRYNEEITTCEDWDLWIRVAKIGKLANLPNFLMKYRIVENSNHRSIHKVEAHFLERSKIISSYWGYFGISLSHKQVFEYYYGHNKIPKLDFLSKIRILILAFNDIFDDAEKSLNSTEIRNFSYLLARKILAFWNHSQQNRFGLINWFIIIKKVSFISNFKFVRSVIR